MKKKVYVALLTLCCPIILNTQQAFAEESTSSGTTVVSSEVLEEAVPTETTESSSTQTPETTETIVGSTECTETTTTTDSSESTSTTEEATSSDSATTETTTDSTTETTATTESSETATSEAADTEVSITVTFVEEGTGTVISQVPVSGIVGDVVGITLPTNGYFVLDTPVDSGFSVELDENVNPILVGTLTADSKDFEVIMRPFNASGDAQINFIDEEGNPVIGAPNVLLGGEVGDQYSYDPPVLAGYTYSGGTVTGTLTDTLQTIDVVYTRVQTNVTFLYVDEAGNQIPELIPDTFQVKYGEIWDVTPAKASDWELVSVNGQPYTEADLPIVVTGGEADQTFVLAHRQKGAEVIVDPVTPPAAAVATPAVTPALATPPLKVERGTLPKTGEEENSIIASVAGVMVVAQAAYVLKKKHEGNDFSL